MKGLTFLGSEPFFLLLFPFLYWCLDSRLGLRLALISFLSGYLNHALKQAFAQPRPFTLAPGIDLVREYGYGLPSGHAQGAVVLWGLLAWQARRRWVWVPAAALMLAVGVSRVYLGVHFPTDVLGGWLAGALLLAASIAALKWLSGRSLKLPWWAWLLAVSLLAALALLAFSDSQAAAMVAALWGFAVGYLLRRRFFPDGEGGTVPQRLLRLPLGLVVLLGLYLGPRALFPASGGAWYLGLRFLRYALVGLWAALGAPLLFRWVGLAPSGDPRAPGGPGAGSAGPSI